MSASRSVLRMRLCLALMVTASVALPAFAGDIWVQADEKPKAGEVRVDFVILSISEEEAVVLLAGESGADAVLLKSVAKVVADGRGWIEAAGGLVSADGGRGLIELEPGKRAGGSKPGTRFYYSVKPTADENWRSLSMQLEHLLEAATEVPSLGKVTTAVECKVGEARLAAVVRPHEAARNEKVVMVYFVFVKIEAATENIE